MATHDGLILMRDALVYAIKHVEKNADKFLDKNFILNNGIYN